VALSAPAQAKPEIVINVSAARICFFFIKKLLYRMDNQNRFTKKGGALNNRLSRVFTT
jgi:hypothetical protein